MQKLKGGAASLRLKTVNDYPYFYYEDINA